MVDQPASAVAARAVAYCRGAVGTPYLWGGTTSNGYDCSGLVYAAYRDSGFASIPRTSEEQYAAGYMDVPWGGWAPGDLIFSQWPGDGAKPGHVVIYAGGGETIAAPHTGTTVQFEPTSTFGGSHYVGSKRPVPLQGAQTATGAAGTMSDDSSGDESLSGTSGIGAAIGGGVGIVAIGVVLLVAVGVLVVMYRRKSSAPPAAPSAGGAE